MSDSGLVDAAVMEVLANDAALMALCPGGVYWGVRGSPDATAFVIVDLLDHAETPDFGGTLYEQTFYLVRATMLADSRVPIRQAAARIHQLLHRADLDLADAGYAAMHCRRIKRVALKPEFDPANKQIWFYGGGQYELTLYPTS